VAAAAEEAESSRTEPRGGATEAERCCGLCHRHFPVSWDLTRSCPFLSLDLTSLENSMPLVQITLSFDLGLKKKSRIRFCGHTRKFSPRQYQVEWVLVHTSQ